MGAGPLYAALDRHRGRRSQGVPTLGVIEGLAPHELIPALYTWASVRKVACVDLTGLALTADEMPGAWLRAAGRSVDLGLLAGRWLSTKLQREASGLTARAFARKTPYEREALRQGLEGEERRVVGVCFRLLGTASPYDGAWSWEEVAALYELLGSDDELLLLLSAWVEGADERLPLALKQLARLVEARPRCAALLLCPTGWPSHHVSPNSKVAALLAEGRLPTATTVSELLAPGRDATGALPRVRGNGGVDGDGATTLGRGEAPSTFPAGQVGALRPLHGGQQPPSGPPAQTEVSAAPVDEARSAAERFLYERLNEYGPTRGLFELNAPVASQGETRALEVDLLCRELKLAIELDGYYHFAAPEAYRRDRRKDVDLQRAGYVVLRFLSDDVVTRLESILATVVRAVEWRRARKESASWARTPSRRSPPSR